MNRIDELKKNLIDVMHEDDEKTWKIFDELLKEKNLEEKKEAEIRNLKTRADELKEESKDAARNEDFGTAMALAKEANQKRTEALYAAYIA